MFWGFWEEKYEFDKQATNEFYESPARIKQTLEKIRNKYPEATAIVANEMTKIYEKFLNSNEAENIKGEITCLVSFDR